MITIKFKYKQISNIVSFSSIQMLDNILKSRGVASPKDFLNVNESNIEDFHLFDNMDRAVECFDKHFKAGSKMVTLVDSDVDGNTSNAFLYLYLNQLSQYLNIPIQLDYIVQDGKKHGLNNEVMLQIEKGEYKVVFAPDSSSNDVKEHKVLFDNNIDIVVLDHHEISNELTSVGGGMIVNYNPFAIIINNQSSSKITNKTLTGVGVVYKFCKALDEYYKVNFADQYLDLVALGTIADSANLSNLESRYLVLKGIKQIEDKLNKNIFITKLIEKQAYSMKNKVTIMGIAFYVSPLINACIRVGEYEDNVDLFKAFIGVNETKITKIRGKGEVELSIQEYAVRLCESCKRKQTKVVDECIKTLDKQIEEYGLNSKAILVCNGETVDKNFTGLIANKLASKYQKPCLVLRLNKGNFDGSMRGFDKKNIKDIKQWCNDTGLFHYAQGHSNAAGCSIANTNIDKLYEIINQLEYTNILEYNVDGIFNDKTLNKSIVELIAKYSDLWGNGVDEPLFAIENIILNSNPVEVLLMGTTKSTIKFIVNDVEFIKYKTNEDYYNEIMKNPKNKFTIIGRFGLNEYQGYITPQVIIEDIEFEKTNEVKKFKF